MNIIRVVNRSELGPALCQLRHRLGLTQVQVADIAGLPQPTVSWAETHGAPPVSDTILRLAAALQAVIVLDPLDLLYQAETNAAMSQFGGQLLDGPRTPASDMREDR